MSGRFQHLNLDRVKVIPLNEAWCNKPSSVISAYCISATNIGRTQVAFGFFSPSTGTLSKMTLFNDSGTSLPVLNVKAVPAFPA